MSEEITAHRELEELAEAYREADAMEKLGKAAKDQLKGPIFDLISEVVRDEVPLARKTIRVSREVMSEAYDDEFETWRTRNFPTWNLVGVQTDEDGYNIEIEEDDYYMKYEFVVGEYKYGRTVVNPTPTFDAEKFVKENPNLSDLIDEETKIVYTLNDRKASRHMADHPDSKAIFEKYIQIGQPSVKMIPIKQVVEE